MQGKAAKKMNSQEKKYEAIGRSLRKINYYF